MAEEFNLKFKLSLDNENKLSDTLKRATRDANTFSAALSRGILDAGKDIAGFAAKTAKSLSQLATGDLGIASNAKKVLELRNNIAQLSVNANLGAGGIEGLRKKIHELAQSSNQMQGDVTEALNAFVARTGDINTATKNMELYGKVALATGATLSEVAEVGVELSDKLGIKEQADAMAVLVAQAKMGRIEFADMAKYAPKILAAASSSGATGAEGIAGAGAAIQVIAKAAGGKQAGARAATMYERMVATVQTNKSRERIAALGVDVTNGRDINEIFMDIVRKTGGDPTKMRDIFRTAEGARGAEMFAKQFRETGDFGMFKEFRAAGDKSRAGENAKMLKDDFETMRNTGLASLNANLIKIAATMDNKVGPAFEFAAHHADKLGKAFDWIVSNPLKSGGIAVTGLLTANIAKSVVPELLKGGGIGGALAKLTGGGDGQRVFVTNWPHGGFGGGGNPAGDGASGGVWGFAKKWGTRALTGATGLGVAGSTALIGTTAVAAAPLVYAMHERSSLVERTIAEREHQAAERRQRRESIVRRGSGPVIAGTGGSLGSLDAQLRADSVAVDKLNVNVNIDSDGKVTADVNGTRSPEAMARRSAGGAR